MGFKDAINWLILSKSDKIVGGELIQEGAYLNLDTKRGVLIRGGE